MVGVFTKFRAAALNVVPTRGYLTYAVGEVVLIVVGILIAIQLDAAQQYRQERALERKYIALLLEDVRYDYERASNWSSRFEDKVNGLQLAKDYFYSGEPPADAGELFSRVGRGGLGSRGPVLTTTTTIEELISTGNLSYITGDRIKAAILNFFAYKEFINAYVDNLRSDFATYTNSSRPFSPSGGLVADPRDTARALERYRRPEFLDLVNQEMTYAYSLNAVMTRHIAMAESLAADLERYLESL